MVGNRIASNFRPYDDDFPPSTMGKSRINNDFTFLDEREEEKVDSTALCEGSSL